MRRRSILPAHQVGLFHFCGDPPGRFRRALLTKRGRSTVAASIAGIKPSEECFNMCPVSLANFTQVASSSALQRSGKKLARG